MNNLAQQKNTKAELFSLILSDFRKMPKNNDESAIIFRCNDNVMTKEKAAELLKQSLFYRQIVVFVATYGRIHANARFYALFRPLFVR